MEKSKEQKLDLSLLDETSEQSEQRQRIEQAVGKFCKKEMRKLKPKKKYGKPEELVVEQLMGWYRLNGFFMKRYESKAKRIGNVWRQAGLDKGTPDLGGVCPKGYAHWCEVKAPGYRSRVSEEQYAFLCDVIKRGGFGCVADSVDYMIELYDKYIALDLIEERRRLLYKAMPK